MERTVGPTLVRGALLALVALVGCYPSLPRDLVSLEPLEVCPSMKVAELEAKARHYQDQTDLLTLRCALGQLRAMTLSEIHKTPLATKLSYLIATRFAHNPVKQSLLGAEGARWAEIAGVDSKNPDGELLYYHGLNLGMVLAEKPPQAKKLRATMVNALESAARLSPQVDQGGPLRALGAFYLSSPLPPYGAGNLDKALDLLRTAASEFSRHPRNHFFLAMALWQTEQNAARAEIVKHLEKSELLLAEKDYVELADQWKTELKDLIDEIKAADGEASPQPTRAFSKRRR